MAVGHGDCLLAFSIGVDNYFAFFPEDGNTSKARYARVPGALFLECFSSSGRSLAERAEPLIAHTVVEWSRSKESSLSYQITSFSAP
jgi:hypothetical protein